MLYVCFFVFLYRAHVNMFNEDEDWNDEQDSQILTKTVLENTQKANRSPNGKVDKFIYCFALLCFAYQIVTTATK